MIANSPIEPSTLMEDHAIDVHQYKNLWQNFSSMSLPEHLTEHMEGQVDSNHGFLHLT